MNKQIKDSVKKYYVQSHMFVDVLGEYISLFEKYKLPIYSKNPKSNFSKEIQYFVEMFTRGINAVFKKKFEEFADRMAKTFPKSRREEAKLLKLETKNWFSAYQMGYKQLSEELVSDDAETRKASKESISDLLKHHLSTVMDIEGSLNFRDESVIANGETSIYSSSEKPTANRHKLSIKTSKISDALLGNNKATFLAYKDPETYLAVQAGGGLLAFEFGELARSSSSLCIVYVFTR